MSLTDAEWAKAQGFDLQDQGNRKLISTQTALAPIEAYRDQLYPEDASLEHLRRVYRQNQQHAKNRETKIGLTIGTAIGLPLALFLLLNGAPELAVVAATMVPAFGCAVEHARRNR